MRWRNLNLARIGAALMLVTALASIVPVSAEVLQGRIEKEDANTRISRPAAGAGGNGGAPLRIARPKGDSLRGGVADVSAFKTPLAGRAQDEGFSLGAVQPGDFASIPPNKFDLGAERGSKEMMLAWERWHKQLSAAIYQRWSEMADSPGKATLRITVTRDGHITPVVVQCLGGRRFERGLLAAIMSLDGNPGLSFPSKSQRPQVTFETDYVASTDVQPGYSWVKNDFEKVRENY